MTRQTLTIQPRQFIISSPAIIVGCFRFFISNLRGYGRMSRDGTPGVVLYLEGFPVGLDVVFGYDPDQPDANEAAADAALAGLDAYFLPPNEQKETSAL